MSESPEPHEAEPHEAGPRDHGPIDHGLDDHGPDHAGPAPGGLHALIIEDDLVSGLGLQMALTPLGFSSFAFASTAVQALEQARLRRPDLMTVDVNLLHGDSPEAVREIEGVLGALMVLYVTGAPPGAPELSVALDGRELICKPFGLADVQAAYGRLRRPRAL